MKMVVLGDSVNWGQGLLPEHKFYMNVYLALHGSLPGPSDNVVLAHSGARIAVNATLDDQPALDGEVPDAYPSILQQCESISGDVAGVSLVIVNGGINDVGAFSIVNPLTDEVDLREKINLHCHDDMVTLLGAVKAKFPPTTRIMVPGYFPILSEESDPFLLSQILSLYGVNLDSLFTLLGDIVFHKIYKQSQIFFDLSTSCLASAVTDANNQFGGAPATFCKVPFLPENAALAPAAWLWGVTADLTAEDEVIADREVACNRDESDPIRRQTCFRASVGHPNFLGAQQYANAIIAALRH